METSAPKKRQLSAEARKEIHRRYYDRVRSGEKVEDIAREFDIVRQWVPVVARAEEEKVKAPVNAPDRAGG